MREDLLQYYERELTFLRHMGAEFAGKYPKIASRLILEAGKCEDPHVERLLESFAFLAARVHLKIDDDFPEIIEALLHILYPHYIRPIPSMSVVEFHLDPEQGKLTSGLKVPKDSLLYSQPVGSVPCKFRTCYETILWPISVKAAEWKTPDRLRPAIKASDAVAALRLELHCFPDITFEKLKMQALRFYLSGESNLTHTLLELLCNSCAQILVRDRSNSELKPVILPPKALRQVGFAEDEGMLPYSRRSFDGYRLLQEYFCFPEKFCFVELAGMEQVAAAGFGDKIEVVFLIAPFERQERKQILEVGISEKTFQLGCTPIVNLFQQVAEPILLDQTRYEYRIVPDARREAALEIFSVDEVLGVSPHLAEPIPFEPFYSYRHAAGGKRKQAFWHATRRPSGWRTDRGTDVYLALVDLSSRPVRPDADAITVRLTCSNRDLPSRLPFGSEDGDFQLEGGGPITRIVSLVKPTNSFEPPLGRSLLWRLLSQFSLNYLSLVSEGKEALQEILRVHNFTESVFAERQIEGIISLQSRSHFARVVSENGISFARGTRVEIEFDEEQFVGGGVYTFASVLERFLGLYASLNSFSQLVAGTRQRKGDLRQWPPRSGQRVLM